MAINLNIKGFSHGCQSNGCLDKFGCPPNVCPDFTIRRHDTKPPFKITVEDCDGPLDLQGLVVEVSMWAKAKLKAAITPDDEYFQLADNIGFEQVMIGDIILMDRVRSPEYMLVTGFDEENYFIQVERGYRSTTPGNWKKGAAMKIFRVLDAVAQTEIVLEDERNVDGTTTKDVLQESLLVYEWLTTDTCLPGCYWLEFKLIKMLGLTLFLPGGNWVGPINEVDGVFYTGTDNTSSSVRLSYDSVNDRYLIPADAWTGESHVYSGSYYTGTDHDDGSVLMNRNDIPSDSDTAYSNVTMLAVTPSFTDEVLTPEDFGCILGDGVEWVRRFPVEGEGFLIKITDSPTREW